MQTDDEVLPSIILAGRGLLVKMLITLVLIKFCILTHVLVQRARYDGESYGVRTSVVSQKMLVVDVERIFG